MVVSDEASTPIWLNEVALPSITTNVSAVGGKVHGTPDWWGKRRLAYPIKKQDDGYYAIFNIVEQTLTFHRVPYDHELAGDKIRRAGLPERLAERLAHGQ